MAMNPALAMLAIQSAPLAIGTLQQLFGELRKPTAKETAPLPEDRMRAIPEYYNPYLRR